MTVNADLRSRSVRSLLWRFALLLMGMFSDTHITHFIVAVASLGVNYPGSHTVHHTTDHVTYALKDDM